MSIIAIINYGIIALVILAIVWVVVVVVRDHKSMSEADRVIFGAWRSGKNELLFSSNRSYSFREGPFKAPSDRGKFKTRQGKDAGSVLVYFMPIKGGKEREVEVVRGKDGRGKFITMDDVRYYESKMDAYGPFA